MRRAWLIGLAVLAAGCTARIYEVQTDKTLFLDGREGQKVYVKVTNTSLLKDFPLDRDIRAKLEAKGYTMAKTPEAADWVLRANVKYSGLIRPDTTGGKTVGGAVVGAAAGGVGGYAGGGGSRGAAAAALVGALVGAGLGYWLEESDAKNTFTTWVDLQIEERDKKRVHRASVHARIREKGLTMESAADRVRDDIAFQVSGHF